MEHDVEHDELWWMDERLLGKMLIQYFCRVHPSKIVKLFLAENELFELMQILVVLSVLEEVDVFVLFERQDVESGIVTVLYLRNSDEPDERDEVMGGRDYA